MKFKATKAAIETAGDDLAEGEFFVYPSTFTREPDSYGDVVAKGAFLDTIARWKADGESKGHKLPGLFGHRMDDPDYFVAEATDMGEDEHGWWVKGKFDLENPKAVQVYRLVKGGRLNQLSFAYSVLDEASVEVAPGKKANELRKLDVYEFSFVPIGANQDTSVEAIKGASLAVEALSLKAGRVLSAKNLEGLKAARDAIDAVLASAESPNDSEPTGSGNSDEKSADSPGQAETAAAASATVDAAAAVKGPKEESPLDESDLMLRLKLAELTN